MYVKRIMAKKKDLSQLTFCIPIRVDSDYRLKNLHSVLTFYSHRIQANYIVLEADNMQHIKSLPKIDGLRYEFVRDNNSIFHRTHYINMMLRKTETPLAAIWDADAIAPVRQLQQAYSLVLDKGLTMAYPYDGRFWNVNLFHSTMFNHDPRIRILENNNMPRILMSGYHSVGGAFIVNVEAYRRCGWENEHFAGWGPEDVERYHRLEILGERPSRVDGGLFHLYHTRGVNSGDYDKDLAKSTKREYSHVCSMKPDELRTYINTWEWTK